MAFCRSCGQPIGAEDRFCTACGTSGPLQPDVPAGDTDRPGSTDPPRIQDPAGIRWTNTVLGMSYDFFVTAEGAGQEASRAVSGLNTGVTVAGALLGSLATAGAGLMTMARENDSIRWDDTRSVALNRRNRTVTVTRKSLICPIRLYCTEENYPAVERFIKTHVDPALIRE